MLSGENDPLFAQVQELGDRYRATLGMLPARAFREYANNGLILVCSENGQVYAYLLYRLSKKWPGHATIAHLCVDEAYRGKGYAEALVEEVKTLTRGRDGIRLACREDYAATHLWPRLGFQNIGKRSGRGRDRAPLIKWIYSHSKPLLSRMQAQSEMDRVVAVIDANVFFDTFDDGETDKSAPSKALLSDWLTEFADFRVTSEMKIEIDRQLDPDIRNRSLRELENFTQIHGDGADFDTAQRRILDGMGEPSDENQRSDIRQLAWAVAGGARYFITRDGAILKRRDKLLEMVDLIVCEPTEFIIEIDRASDGSKYCPRAFESTPLTSMAIQDLERCDAYINQRRQETHGALRSRVRIERARESTRAFYEIIDRNSRGLAVALEQVSGDRLVLPLLRCTGFPLAQTVIRSLVASLASRADVRRIDVTDPFISDTVREALIECDYIGHDGAWVRPILRGYRSITDVTECLREFGPTFHGHVEALLSPGSNTDLLRIERSLSPLKIQEIDVPCFVAPIHAKWASQMFDGMLAEQTLFRLPPELGLSLENVYYRSATQQKSIVPGRVLWYVTTDSSLIGTQAIRASSYIDEVVVELPKPLFRRFSRLGIYAWNNISELVSGDMDKKIMAFRFSRTEVFRNPISLERVKGLFVEHGRKANQFQSPVRISPSVFEALYVLGQNGLPS